jgi:ankyrin repeat protein
LIYAVTQGQQELEEFLVGRGASVDLADDAGDTPLMHAARLGLPDIVGSLLDRGADPLARNNAGKNAIDAARDGAKSLTAEFNDTGMAVEDLENSIARYGRIASMLKEAEADAAQKKEIASCHNGISRDITVRRPLKYKMLEI